MKTQKDKSYLTWWIVVIATAIVFMIIGYSVRGVENNNGYSQSDSIARDSIITRIDTLNHYETIVKERIRTIRETDTVYYTGTDTVCIEIIERKNKLIAGQDTLIDLLDLECRSYSELLRLETSRFAALSYKMDSTIVLYKDSITAQRKYYKKRVLWYKFTTTIAAALGIYGTIR